MTSAVEAVLYLEGTAFVTAEILRVDGGQSAGMNRGARIRGTVRRRRLWHAPNGSHFDVGLACLVRRLA